MSSDMSKVSAHVTKVSVAPESVHRNEVTELSNLLKVIETNKVERFCDKFQRVQNLAGHSDYIRGVYLSQDETFVISCSNDKTVKFWDLESCSIKSSIEASTSDINCLAVDSTEDSFAIGTQDNKIHIWSVSKQKLKFTLEGHVYYVKSVAFSPDDDYLASNSAEPIVYIWDLNSKKLHFKFEGHKSSVGKVCFHPNLNYLISCSDDRMIFVWNLVEEQVEFKLKAGNKPITSVCCDKTGELMASAGGDNPIKIWNFKQKNEVLQFIPSYHVNVIQFINSRNFLASGGTDQVISIWSISDRSELFVLDGHTASITELFISNDGNTIVSGSFDNTIKIWDLDLEQENFNFKSHTDLVISLALTQDNSYLASSSFDQSIIIYNLLTEKEEQSLTYHFGVVYEICFSSDSEYLASCSFDQTIKIFNFKQRELAISIADQSNAATHLCFSLSNTSLISSFEDKTIRIFSVPKGEILSNLQSHSKPITKLCLHPNREILASSSEDKDIALWDLSKNTRIHTFKEMKSDKSTPKCIEFTRDGKFLAAGYTSSKLTLFNLELYRNEISFYLQEEDSVYSLSCSTDSRFLVSGHFSGMIVVWDILGKSEEFRLKSHRSTVHSLVLCKDATLYSGSKDTNIKRWRLAKYEVNDLIRKQTEIIEKVMNNNIEEENQKKNEVDADSNPEPMQLSSSQPCTLDTCSIYQILHVDFFYFYNALYKIRTEDYREISSKAWCTRISNLKMTPLHFAAYKGVTGPLATLIENSSIIKIRPDELGRSPIFYSIQAKHQNTTDLILNILILISEKCDFINWASSFNSIKNDLPLIIKNSSSSLPNFLASCFYFKDELPVTGVALIRAKFLPTINPDSLDFINVDAKGEKENLRIKACLFEIPASHGSQGSINLIRAVLASSNKEIFNTQFIRFFIISKWQVLIKLIYLYGAVLWINLALLVLLLSEVQLFWVYAVLFLFVNLVMLAWEYFRMKSGFFEYWMHFMSGIVTNFKCVVSIVWVVLLMAGIRAYELSWVVVFLNVLRGMAGFRAFDETRYYLQLIIQSIKSIRFFVLIYIYTTFSAGLLSVVVQD